MKYLFLALALIFVSCKKEQSCTGCNRPYTGVEAMVIDAGVQAADGCGWILRVGASDLHPVNLPDSLKQTQLSVILSFNTTNDKFYCGLAPGNGLQSIEILKIRRK